MKKKKILAIQPHSDDVLLSASHLLLSGAYDVQVLCVESDPKRVPEDKKLYEFLGIPYANLGLEFIDNSYYEFHRRYKGCRLEESVAYLREYFGDDMLHEIRNELIQWVKVYMDKNEGVQIVGPLGIGHPFHLFIHELLRVSPYHVQFYREFPHSYKRRSQEQLKEAQSRMTLVRSVPVEEFADVKWQLASKFYRTQSGLLFYEQGYIKKNLPEEIYEE